MIHPHITTYISADCDIPTGPVTATLALFDDGATLPFIARYRKEKTGGLTETQIRTIQTRYDYYVSLFARQETILKSIQDQGKLNSDLESQIKRTTDKQHLEDLYLPYKVKRKTKADLAKDQGLGPLAEIILKQTAVGSVRDITAPFIHPETDIATQEDALSGARIIIAQTIADTSNFRTHLRDKMTQSGVLETKVTSKFKETRTKFDMYYQFSEPLRTAASHRLLAIRRGEKENVLNWKIKLEEHTTLGYLEKKLIKTTQFRLTDQLKTAIKDAYTRLIHPSIQTECFNLKCETAEGDSIRVFSDNLHNLLMAAPAGEKVIMGIDPGFRTGCKIAIVNRTGLYQDTATIFPVPPMLKLEAAEKTVLHMIKQYNVSLIAIGNGTGSKETMQFIKQVIKTNTLDVIPVIVNESGASVYSASETAVEEYPDLDVTVRGAISIAHRLQDPLAELVKIDPKAIGVGQYQHDVNQTQLKAALTFTTETAVNAIGVDLNTASKALLTYIAGIGPTIAKNIVAYRSQNGAFSSRKTLLKVPKLGPKAYEQCIGFLRIKKAKNPLDNTSIHPEAYTIVQQMADDMKIKLDHLIGNPESVNQLPLEDYVTDTIGLPTLKDIQSELLKPGVDPRDEFTYAKFDDAIDEIEDLKEGMTLNGVVTNVTNFGAFVDIGVHQDGLIHISKLSNAFIKNPQDVISVGEPVSVTVIQVDLKLKRIQLARVLKD
ncbi:RNA-binding transcriptional accessory protein [bacterium]|jgi:protein Tex|nr:RNA-binding transcriptional accessory protein [bacterium]